MIQKLLKLKNEIKQNNPLIHCITNHITANDCANILLAVSASPIMAEHPKEVAEITRFSRALAINLGSINDLKMEAMLISGTAAKEHNIPIVIDLVGVGCSTPRLNFAKKFITDCHPNVIKGNVSEIKAICGVNNHAYGVDTGDVDVVNSDNVNCLIETMHKFSERTQAVVFATGAVDVIVYKNEAFTINNGCETLSRICGTGCMLNVLTAAFISSGQVLEGSILAAALMGICGELSQTENGLGTFKTNLFDNISAISDETFANHIKLERTSH